MKKSLCLLLTMMCILLTGCGNGQVASDTEILVNEADSAKNTYEMAENISEEAAEAKEPVPETKYITIDLLGVDETHIEGETVAPLNLKILSAEKNGIDWANEWYESNNLSLPMIGTNWDHFYDDVYEYQWFWEQLHIYEKETGNCLYVLI